MAQGVMFSSLESSAVETLIDSELCEFECVNSIANGLWT